jgi:hypothetical protein
MATYKGIKGFEVQNLASDPTTASSVGQFYYNTTGGVFKYVATGTVGAWASGGALPAAITQQACIGITTAALSAFGNPLTSAAHTFDGTSWTTVNSGNTARRNLGAAGIQTAGLVIAGQTTGTSALTEQYNGSTWTETGDVPSGRQGLGGAGTTTAAVAFGGGTGSGVATADTFNGTSWTAANSMNQARDNVGGGGTSATDAMCAGGNVTKYTEKYNGTSWTEVGTLNNNYNEAAVSMQGTSTAFMTFGGDVSPGAKTELWNGTSWVEQNNLATGRATRGCGTTASALCIGGGGSAVATVEEWTIPDIAIKTVATS